MKLKAVIQCFFIAFTSSTSAFSDPQDNQAFNSILSSLGFDYLNQHHDSPQDSLDNFSLTGPFFSTKFSTISRSCSSCHDPLHGWAQGNQLKSELNFKRAVPSLIGAKHARYLFWDGRALSLEAQVMEVLENPIEMNGSRMLTAKYSLMERSEVGHSCAPKGTVVTKLLAIDSSKLSSTKYLEYYQTLDQDEKNEVDRSYACVSHKIAEYVRKIPEPTSIWPVNYKNVRIKEDDIPPNVYRGAKIFAGKAKCATCHYGPYLTDNQFHNIGIGDSNVRDISDSGRYGVISVLRDGEYNNLARKYYKEYTINNELRASEELWGAFKTPSLRGINQLHSFMHNGKFHSLKEVVEYYDKLDGAIFPSHHYQNLFVPLGLTDEEKADLIDFLKSL